VAAECLPVPVKGLGRGLVRSVNICQEKIFARKQMCLFVAAECLPVPVKGLGRGLVRSVNIFQNIFPGKNICQKTDVSVRGSRMLACPSEGFRKGIG